MAETGCAMCKDEGESHTVGLGKEIACDDSKECLFRGENELHQLESKEHQDLAQEFDLIVKASQKGGGVCDVADLIKVPHGHVDIANAFGIPGISGQPLPHSTGSVATSVPPVHDNSLAGKLTEGEDGKRYPCGFCGKGFSRKDSRKRHERIHTQDRPHKCSYCIKTFISKSHQKAHESIHTGIREFGCSYCDKAFQRSDKRNRHEKIHFRDSPAGHAKRHSDKSTGSHVQHSHPKVNIVNNEEVAKAASSSSLKYKCHFCPKTFPRVDSRKRHERTHTGQKPHTCSFCDHSFVTAYHKMLHERTHTKEKPHKCLICKKEFSRMDSLRRHEKLHL